MGDFNRGKRPGGRSFGGGSRGGFGGNRGGFGGNRGGFGGGRDGGRPQMHKAICSECGNECELPFRPSGDRPVFCSTCFDKQGGGSIGRPNRSSFGGGERRERSDRPRFEDKQMHDAVCAKCGENCQVPFKPTPGKQVFCDKCFDRSVGNTKSSADYSGQFKTLNEKLDKLIKLLTPAVPEVKVIKSTKKEVHPVKSGKAGLPKAEFNGVKKIAPKKVVTKKKK